MQQTGIKENVSLHGHSGTKLMQTADYMTVRV